MKWIMQHWAVIVVVVMFLVAMMDPRPRNDMTRRGKRYAQRRYWK